MNMSFIVKAKATNGIPNVLNANPKGSKNISKNVDFDSCKHELIDLSITLSMASIS